MVTLSGSIASVRSTQTRQLSSVSPSMPGDQVDVDLREADRLREPVDTVDLRRPVRPAVQLEDPVVEVLDAEAEPRDAHLADRLELRLGQRARLALEGDFLRCRPRGRRSQAIDEPLQLRGRKERRRPAAEVDEVERPARAMAGISQIAIPLPRDADRGTPPPRARSCWCRRGSSRSGTASGRTECAGTGPAARPSAPTASAGMASAAHGFAGSTRKTAGSSRRSSCRPRSGRPRPCLRFPAFLIYDDGRGRAAYSSDGAS